MIAPCSTRRATRATLFTAALPTVPRAARHARDSRPPAVLCIVMPDSLDMPVPQRLARFVVCQRMCTLRVAQLSMQRRRPSIVRAQRRMPLPTGALVASAEREDALPLRGVSVQRGSLLGHRSRRVPLTPARIDQRSELAAQPDSTHPHEQPPQPRLLRRAAHYAGRPSPHNSCSSTRVSPHPLHWSYGCRRNRWIAGRRSIARSVSTSLPRSYSPICNSISTSS